jgi:hypothetical protein
MKTKILILTFLVVIFTTFTTKSQIVHDSLVQLNPWTLYDSATVVNDTIYFNNQYFYYAEAVSTPFTFENNLDSLTINFSICGHKYPNSPNTFNYLLMGNISPFTHYSFETIEVTDNPIHHHINVNLTGINISSIPLILDLDALANYEFIKIFNIEIHGFYTINNSSITEYTLNSNNPNKKLVKVYNLNGQEVPYSTNLSGIYIFVYDDHSITKTCIIK